jgi:hypothetical protein
MIDAAECRRQAVIAGEEARTTENLQLISALMAVARSWAILANQMDRVKVIRDQLEAGGSK